MSGRTISSVERPSRSTSRSRIGSNSGWSSATAVAKGTRFSVARESNSDRASGGAPLFNNRRTTSSDNARDLTPSEGGLALELENQLGLADEADLVAGGPLDVGRIVLDALHFGAEAL